MDMITILLLDTVKLHEKPSINIGLHLSKTKSLELTP